MPNGHIYGIQQHTIETWQLAEKLSIQAKQKKKKRKATLSLIALRHSLRNNVAQLRK
jgi:hypothetical protein